MIIYNLYENEYFLTDANGKNATTPPQNFEFLVFVGS
jgi:hypothetical protein